MNRLLFFISAMLITSIGFSQIEVKEGERAMSQGNYNALSIVLGNADLKMAEDNWEKFLKGLKGKTKKDKKAKEFFSDNCMIPEMSSNTIDIYSKLTQMGNDVELAVWYDLGGAYLSAERHEEAYAVAVKKLNEYSLNVSVAAIEANYEMEADVLKKMESDLSGLKKDQSNLEDEIAKCEKKIEEAKKKIEENGAAQNAKSGEIKTQMSKVKEIKVKLSGM